MAVVNHGVPHKVIDIPEGLRIVQRGLNPLHYEIIPTINMSFNEYKSLLAKIIAVPWV